MYVALCEPWPLPDSCPALSGSPAITGAALEAASEVLWERTGHQFGSCSITLRPCRTDCGPSPNSGAWWSGVGWPTDSWSAYARSLFEFWWAADCGRCSGCCSCNEADTLRLPERAQSIQSVIVDGVELVEEANWLFYNNELLVRTDGEQWPMCQDWTVPVTGTGAWSVSATFGLPVPTSGQFAVAELAREYALWCSGEECMIPATAKSVTRQGVTFSIPETTEDDLANLPMVSKFLYTFNPLGIRDRARAWNPDDFCREWHQRT